MSEPQSPQVPDAAPQGAVPPPSATPPPVPPPQPPPHQPPPYGAQNRSNRVTQVAAWIGIVAGSLVIVAVIFLLGFVIGQSSGGDDDRDWHRGDRPFHHGESWGPGMYGGPGMPGGMKPGMHGGMMPGMQGGMMPMPGGMMPGMQTPSAPPSTRPPAPPRP